MSLRCVLLPSALLAVACGGGGGDGLPDGRILLAAGTIGPAGGELSAGAGAYAGFRIVLPAGALLQPTVVRCLALRGSDLGANPVLAIEPDSALLVAPAAVTLPVWHLRQPFGSLLVHVISPLLGSVVLPVHDFDPDRGRVEIQTPVFGTLTIEQLLPGASLREYLPSNAFTVNHLEGGLMCTWQEMPGWPGPSTAARLTLVELLLQTDESLQLAWSNGRLKLGGYESSSQSRLDLLDWPIDWAPERAGVEVSGSVGTEGRDPLTQELLYHGLVAHTARLSVVDALPTPRGLFTDVVQLELQTVWMRGNDVGQQRWRLWLAHHVGIVAVQLDDDPMRRLVDPAAGGGSGGLPR